jgi:uncharacterized protein YjiS (DUF1127 family)
MLRLWIRRNRERWELAAMSARDFGDLGVPDSVVRHEVRYWRWQNPSPQWRARRTGRRGDRAPRQPRARVPKQLLLPSLMAVRRFTHAPQRASASSLPTQRALATAARQIRGGAKELRGTPNTFAEPRVEAAPAQRRGRSRPAGLLAILRRWAERERERRQLAAMSARDFGDLGVPESLIRDELRRWPWQPTSPQWRAVAGTRQTGVPAIVTGLPLPGLELAQSLLATTRRRGGEA